MKFTVKTDLRTYTFTEHDVIMFNGARYILITQSPRPGYGFGDVNIPVKYAEEWIKSAFKYVIGESSLVSIFVCMLGLLSVASLRVDKDKTIEAYNIFKDMFVKSVESKSSLELAVWFLILTLIILLPARRSS